MTYIQSIGTALPSYHYEQEELISYMQERSNDEKVKKKTAIIFTKSRIKHRYSVLPDFAMHPEQTLLFNVEAPHEPLVQDRLQVYKDTAVGLVASAIRNCIKEDEINEVTDLITVSCTGMMAPGMDVKLIEEFSLSPTVRRYSVNFMGCHAGFQALRLAESICKGNPDAKVLIADVELCTLHFRKPETDDQIVSNSLFADGAAAVLVGGKPGKNGGLKVKDSANKVVLQGQKDMSWDITSDGFLMSLSSYVPDLLGADLRESFDGLFQNMPEKSDMNWAIHPGGPKILKKFAESLDLPIEKLEDSFSALANYGNMSSCTIFFVLHDAWKKLINDKKPVFSAAFGPGLTMEAVLFEPVGAA